MGALMSHACKRSRSPAWTVQYVDTFDVTGSANPAHRGPGPPLGFVRVRMSADPIVSASVGRLATGSALVLLATIASLGVALMLAGRLREPLKDVMHALRQLRDGRYDVQMRPGATGELAELQSAVAEMAKGLRITHEQLEGEVAARTAELSAAMQRIRISDEEKGRLIARGNDLVEDERRRISTEIHDDLNAVLVSVRMQAEALVAADEQGHAETSAAAKRIVELVDTIYGRARAIVRKLRPEIIDALGLVGAAEETVRGSASSIATASSNSWPSRCLFFRTPCRSLPTACCRGPCPTS
jgi:two-component system, NarL family, sensor histidine kinase UhpB